MQFSFQTARTCPVSGALVCLLAAIVLSPIASAQTQVQSVRVLPSTGAVELEIHTTQPVTPRTQVVAGPDRLVIDFPGAAPGPQLRALSVNRGDVVGVRVGLFQSSPPTTRIVLDLKSAAAYQIFPAGKSVMVKLGGPVTSAATAVAPEEATPPPPPQPKVTVGFQNGLLSITADKATLAEVLYEIHTQTGAEIAVPAGAEQEQVFTSIGPAAPKDALASLLDGSPYNFILVGSSSNPNVLERVLLSQKGTSMMLDVSGAQVQGQPMANNGAGVYASTERMRNRTPQPAPEVDEQGNNVAAEDDQPPPEGPDQPQPAPQQPGAPQGQPPQN